MPLGCRTHSATYTRSLREVVKPTITTALYSLFISTNLKWNYSRVELPNQKDVLTKHWNLRTYLSIVLKHSLHTYLKHIKAFFAYLKP